MDKTISLLMTAMVVMVAGVIVVTIGSGSLGDFDQSASDLGDQGCDFQQQRARENPDYIDQMSEECRTEEFEQEVERSQQERDVVGSAVNILE